MASRRRKRNELTRTRGRTRTIYTDTLTRGSGTGGVRREKGQVRESNIFKIKQEVIQHEKKTAIITML